MWEVDNGDSSCSPEEDSSEYEENQWLKKTKEAGHHYLELAQWYY